MSQKVNGGARLTSLDGLKGIISFFIIFVHFCNRNPAGNFPLSFIPDIFTFKGWMFVELFFIISGFLFALSNRAKTYNATFAKYSSARLIRLYPAVFFATVLDVGVRIIGILVTGTSYRLTVANLVKSLTFASTLIFCEEPFPTVVWYIHVLFVCYIFYFFIAKLKNVHLYRAALFLMFAFGLTLYFLNLNIPFLFRNIGRGLLSFALGSLIWEFQKSANQKTKLSVSLIALAFSAVIMALCLKFTFVKVFFGEVLLGFTLIFFPSTVLCVLNLRPIEMLFSLNAFTFLGKISMATFLVHVPILNLFGIVNYNSVIIPFDKVWGFLVIMLSIFAVAIAWHYLIEQRLIPKIIKFINSCLVPKG